MTLKLLKNNKINNNDNMNTLDISLSDQTLNEVERNTIGIISLDKFTLFSSSLSKIILSLLSLGKCSETRGSIFSLSSLGLSRRSINKDFNTMDSRVYANASHENDILKVSSLSKEQYPSIQEPIPIISPLHKLTTSLLSLSKITLSLLSLGKCSEAQGSIFSLSSLSLTRGSIRQHIRFITLICGVLLISTVATAEDTTVETCANGAGTVFVGQVTKHKYCVSNKSMNWWNAVAWCDGMGRRMFDRSDCACSGTVSDCRSKCPELIPVDGDKWVNQWAWTASAASSSGNYHIHLSNGNFDGGGNRHRSNYANKALCY